MNASSKLTKAQLITLALDYERQLADQNVDLDNLRKSEAALEARLGIARVSYRAQRDTIRELEAKLAELRAEQEKVMDPILITLQKGGQPSPADINRLTTLKVQIKQLELKLEKKVRKPKTVDAAKIVPGAPAK